MNNSYARQWRCKRSIIRQRGDSFQVETNINGKRIRETKPTRKEAEKYATDLVSQLAAEGASALDVRGSDRNRAVRLLRDFPTDHEHQAALALMQAASTDYERQDVLAATELFRSRGVGHDLDITRPTPLSECVRFWLRHHPEGRTPPKLADALTSYLERKASRRPATLSEIRHKVRRFCTAFPDASVSDITAEDIDGWLTANIETLGTRRKYLRVFHAFFKFIGIAYQQPKNPTEAVYLDPGETDQSEVEAYSIKEVKSLLDAASKDAAATRIVPILAIGFFAGLRPSEIGGLDWANVDLSQKSIRVTPATAKRRRQRFVEISDNLAAWLVPYCRSQGAVAPPLITFRRDRDDVIKVANVRWLRDGLRHTYGTYHLAAFGDPLKTATEMGHRGNTDLVYQHYRKLVTKDEALKFWEILPSNVSDDLVSPSP